MRVCVGRGGFLFRCGILASFAAAGNQNADRICGAHPEGRAAWVAPKTRTDPVFRKTGLATMTRLH